MLEISGLRSGYGRLEVLHGVDLTVGAGELVTVVGANGAGKTTLLQTISGLLPATGGKVRLGDRDITRLPAEKTARAGLVHVPENRLVFPSLSVADNLRLGAWSRKNREISDDVLELFPRLAKRLGQAAGTLSGGEQQMLAIGRGLMARPRVLVLDEPSLGLAPRAIGEIFSVLGQLCESGDLAILLIEQNARAAFGIADRAYVLDRGAVAMTGTPEELLCDDSVQRAYLGGGYVPTE